MEISVQLHAQVSFSPRKKLPLPIGKEAGWVSPPTLIDAVEKRKSLTLLRIEQWLPSL
jgi:hypothetical protein